MRARVVDKMKKDRPNNELLLVEAAALPEVFGKVAQAKALLQSGQAASAAAAARSAGISRSAFYKYKDAVHRYDRPQTQPVLTLHGVLRDKPGVLSEMLSAFAAVGANVLTVFQDIPAGGAASVSVTADTTGLTGPEEELIRRLEQVDGVLRITRISHKVQINRREPI